MSLNGDHEGDAIVSLLERRKNKLIRIILGTKERLYPDEDDGVFRKVVLDEVNDFFDQITDIVDALQNNRSVVVNQLFLEKLDELKTEIMQGLEQRTS